MLSSAPTKMLANKQMRQANNDGKTYGHVTLHARMAIMNCNCLDSLLPKDIPVPQINSNVNLSNTVIGGVTLALCDGRANGKIKGNDMRVLHYNGDERWVSIGIARDSQLTGARLCTAVSMRNLIKGG